MICPADLRARPLTLRGVPAPDPAAFRAEFPVFERLSYLNAGSDGPVPRRAAQAAEARTRVELAQGRSGPGHSDALTALREGLRGEVAALLRCDAGEVALTHSTTDGSTSSSPGSTCPGAPRS